MKNSPSLFALVVFLGLAFFAPLASESISIGIIQPLTGGLAQRGDDAVRFLKILEEHLKNGNYRYRYNFLLEDGKCGAGNAANTAAMKTLGALGPLEFDENGDVRDLHYVLKRIEAGGEIRVIGTLSTSLPGNDF